ncbi:Signal transduction protein MDG1 [Pleurostoma richardsiae]|uniref:Signal transduction protein MDG1 n=1 Tax=Pleurostoma richardsiae TaxID=41990 RepID=A0AA38S4K9_9PEZI|nr:Signal transduction protein MDG1 [Pleurostoma richardsiae]
MGTFTFKWPHAAQEVYVTGTFDNWAKTEKLEKAGDIFEKTVTLPDASEKIYYKFVVDGNWTTDHTAPQEKDHEGNENNVLTPDRIVKESTSTGAIMSTVAPGSTTAELAKDVPLEKDEKVAVPGTYPETPAAELDKEVKINPLPAADGALNPVKLAPGEPVPDASAKDLNSNVKLDKESYEKADALPGFEVPPVTKNMIPESSLPIAGSNDFTINTVAPGSTTAALAAGVPLEKSAVPEVVKESQEKAGVDPEASGVPAEVKEKEEVEEELLKKVPTAPSTSEGTAGVGTEKSETDKSLLETVTASASGAAAAAAATVTAFATDAAAKLPDSVKDQLPAPVKEAIAPAVKEEKREEVSPEVPEEVKESITEAGKSPEAAANTAAVTDKKEVEAELLKEVKAVEPVGEPSTPEVPAEAPKEEPTPAVNGTEAAEPKAPETPVKPKAPASAATTPSSSKAGDSPATAERKKKNRVSGFFGKIKGKLSHKEK